MSKRASTVAAPAAQGPAAPALPAGPAGAGASRGPRRAARVPTRLWRGALGILGFFAIAEAVTRAQLVDSTYLPPASTILGRVAELLTTGSFLGEVGATLLAWAIGLGLAIAIAVPLGILLGSSGLAYRMSSVVVELMRPIPAVALIPLAILVWGQGLQMKVVLVAYATVWPILYNTIYGVHDVDPVASETARSFGAGRGSILRRVTLPSAAPFVFTGIRVAASIGLIVVVGAELLAGAANGIGTFILIQGSNGNRADLVLAGATVAGILGVLIDLSLRAVERRLFAWRGQEAAA
jgi:NitT/TauT family transport system permease protein